MHALIVVRKCCSIHCEIDKTQIESWNENRIQWQGRMGMRTRSGGEVDARDGGSASSYKWRPAVHISTLGNQNACAENASFDRSSAWKYAMRAAARQMYHHFVCCDLVVCWAHHMFKSGWKQHISMLFLHLFLFPRPVITMLTTYKQLSFLCFITTYSSYITD